MPRPQNYPLDVGPRFTTDGRNAIGKGIGPTGADAGLLHYPNGDLKVHVAHGQARNANKDVYLALAYLDIIDTKLDAGSENVSALQAQVAALHQEIASLRAASTLISSNLDKVMHLFGVVIPAWATRSEVEQGDDMGMVTMSASELGLEVVFAFLQRTQGYAHEQVVRISPPAGTLVARGTSVTVAINLEG